MSVSRIKGGRKSVKAELAGEGTGPARCTRACCIENAATGRNYGAYCPDLPGCVATSATVAETRRWMAEAVKLHIAGLIEDGQPFPEPSSVEAFTETVEV